MPIQMAASALCMEDPGDRALRCTSGPPPKARTMLGFAKIIGTLGAGTTSAFKRCKMLLARDGKPSNSQWRLDW